MNPFHPSSLIPSSSSPQPRLAHQAVGGLIGFADPVHNPVRVGGILELDADTAVNLEVVNLAEIGAEIDHPASGGQVAVDLAVAVAQVDVNRLSLQPPEFGGGRAGKLQVRDVGVGLHGR